MAEPKERENPVREEWACLQFPSLLAPVAQGRLLDDPEVNSVADERLQTRL